MKIQVNQINPKSLSPKENSEKIISCLKESNDDVLNVFPELAISGSPLFLSAQYDDIYTSCMQECEHLTTQKKSLVFGTIIRNGQVRYNALAFMDKGEVTAVSTKKNLTAFDEGFSQGGGIENVKYEGKTVSFGFLEDVADFLRGAQKSDILILCSNTVFYVSKQEEIINYLAIVARNLACPIVFCNRFGAEGGYVYAAGSFVVNEKGELCSNAMLFDNKNLFFDSCVLKPTNMAAKSKESLWYSAITLAIKDYFAKNGIKTAVLGLSGGIDSALVCALAVAALGKENVIGILMPSEFSTEHSVTDAMQSVENLGIRHFVVPIKDCYTTCQGVFSSNIQNNVFSLAEENLQSRLRCVALMYYANKFSAALLNTTNKSEAAVGYGTLYGDTSGALSAIADLYKTQVWQLAKWINQNAKEHNAFTKEPIPWNSINKAPSAELRNGQKDSDSLPEYDVLDKILHYFLQEHKSFEQIKETFVAEHAGIENNVIQKVIRLIKINEWKRRQCPMAVKLSNNCFGIDTRVPIS
jgi:NAD+ synthetase